jgi:HEAT repeat protein
VDLVGMITRNREVVDYMNSTIEYNTFRRQYVARRKNDPRSTEELIRLALTANDEEVADEAIAVLWFRPPNEVLEVGQQLGNSQDPKKRELAARILGQGGIPERMPTNRSLSVLLPMLEREQDAIVLAAICVALADMEDPRVIEPLLHLQHHTDENVRLGVAQGLLRKRDERAISALIELSEDRDVDVRDWATYALAQVKEVDTPALRAALRERLKDDDDIRVEALVGLALRGDAAVIEPLLQELELRKDQVSQSLLEAAIEAGKQLINPRLCAALLNFEALVEDYGYSDDWTEAVARCRTEPLETEPT